MIGKGKIGLLLFVVLAVWVRLTEPLADSDLFWHMAYGRWMLQHHTIIPDHRVFSWTPTQNGIVYCAWLSQTGLYLLHQWLGPGPLYGLRYLVVFAAGGLHFLCGRRLGLGPGTLTVLLGCWFFGSYAGTALKPELFSFGLLNLLVALYWMGEGGRPRLLWTIPLLLIVWANTHGAFFFGFLFVLLATLGRLLDRQFDRVSGVWLTACSVCLMATPYGWDYLVQQYSVRIASPNSQLAVAISAHWEPVYRAANLKLHLAEYWVAMVVLLAAAWPRKVFPGWRLMLPTLAFAAYSLVHIRSSYLWPTVWLYAMFLCKPHWGHRSARLLAGLLVCVCCRAILESYAVPYRGGYLGWGEGYLNPRLESEFVSLNQLGPRLYNSYDCGGYLLWSGHQVMMDSRAFPYLDWLPQYLRLVAGQDFEDLTRAMPAQAAVVAWRDRDWIRQFGAHSEQWEYIYSGPAAAVFRERTPSAIALQYPANFADRFDSLRNLQQVLQIFAGLMEVGDLASAELLVRAARRSFWIGHDDRILPALELHLHGLNLVQRHQYKAALECLERGERLKIYVNHDLLKALRSQLGQ